LGGKFERKKAITFGRWGAWGITGRGVVASGGTISNTRNPCGGGLQIAGGETKVKRTVQRINRKS